MKIIKSVKLLNRVGLHLRAAAELVKTSSKFKCGILVKNGNGNVNGKSLINLMTLAAGYGQELTMTFEGKDAKDAWTAINLLFLNKFGEE